MLSISLFFQFAKFGALCFGGGYMIIPLLFQALVQDTSFLTPEEYGNLLSVSQITPGPVSINTATYVGFLKNGILGSLSASLGLVAPSFILATLALFSLNKLRDKWYVQGFLKGARLAAFVMVLYAISLFANISIMSHMTSPLTLYHHFEQGLDLLPSDFRIHYLEIGVMIASFFLVKSHVSITKVIFLSGLFGFTISLLFSQFPTLNLGQRFNDQSIEEKVISEMPTTSFNHRIFEADMCQEGYAMTWGGVCTCYHPNQFNGMYCDQKGISHCKNNQDCQPTEYCSFWNKQETGTCFVKSARTPFLTPKGVFVLSDSVMNRRSADFFCSSLGEGFRQAKRSDFNCSGQGVGCLDNRVLISLKEKYGEKGFFWLDSLSETQSYYADLNDGTLYHSSFYLTSLVQALCIRSNEGD